MSSAKRKLVIVLLPMITDPSCSFKASVMILSRKMLKRVGGSRHPCLTPTCPEPFSCTAIVVYCAGGFAVEALYDFNQVVVDVA